MRRTRAVLAMLLAAAMAVHALTSRESPAHDEAPDETSSAAEPVEPIGVLGADIDSDEDEVVAIEPESDLLPIRIEL